MKYFLAIDFLEEFDDEVSDVYMDTSSPVSEAYKECIYILYVIYTRYLHDDFSNKCFYITKDIKRGVADFEVNPKM